MFFKNLCLIVGTLCSGSTADFDSVSLGSIPNVPAKKIWKMMQLGWSGDQPWKLGSQKWDGVRLLRLPPYKSTLLIVYFYMGGLAEWLRQRFAKPSFRNGCISSNLISSANAPMDKLVKSLLSKGRSLSVRIRVGVPELCGCATERLGDGLQIRFMQVRFLSLTPRTLK